MSQKSSILDQLKGLKNLSVVDSSGAQNDSKNAAAKKDSVWKSLKGIKELEIQRQGAEALNLETPYFRRQEGHGNATCTIDGKTFLNFSNYDYLGLCDVLSVRDAAKDAIDEYSTSASASRLVAGERSIHNDLEDELADFYGMPSCIAFVSGFVTNVTVIGHIMGPDDVVFVDARSHNSIIQGTKLSGAQTIIFPHNDVNGLTRLIEKHRNNYKRALIVVEGLYSMDGDIADLPELINIKYDHNCQIMVDEAHALGVLGKTGRGSFEHWNIAPTDIDIWMGTLSKTLAGCGGYILADETLTEYIGYTAPGFVYSVGMAPATAAASLEALRTLRNEPDRVEKLRQNGSYFLKTAQAAGLDVGHAEGHAIIPVMTLSSVKAVRASQRLLEKGINVMPIIHPAVEAKAARLRFFLSSEHNFEQIDEAIAATKDVLKNI